MSAPQDGAMEAALAVRARQRALAAADAFLDDLITPPGVAPPPGVGSPPAPVKEAAAKVPDLPGTPSLGGIARDIGRGMVEAPRQIVGGARDALQSASELLDWISGASIELQKPDGTVESVPVSDPAVKMGLPEVKQPSTVTGGGYCPELGHPQRGIRTV